MGYFYECLPKKGKEYIIGALITVVLGVVGAGGYTFVNFKDIANTPAQVKLLQLQTKQLVLELKILKEQNIHLELEVERLQHINEINFYYECAKQLEKLEKGEHLKEMDEKKLEKIYPEGSEQPFPCSQLKLGV